LLGAAPTVKLGHKHLNPSKKKAIKNSQRLELCGLRLDIILRQFQQVLNHKGNV
jgi:hypothetical protein